MQGVPSSLIARNESWVRAQASALVRRLPSNVEKADLIQAGLIAVAQAALGFKWDGDPDAEESKEAFARYARKRVKGAMLDELRQMDTLGRSQRRKVKIIQIARERWQASQGSAPSLSELSRACGISIAEISQLEHAAHMAYINSRPSDSGSPDDGPSRQEATPQDEVEARVDTAILLRRLEKFFVSLPERDRRVIDSYLGVGMTPIQLADSLGVTPSRVSQLYKALCQKIGRHLGTADQRAIDRAPAAKSSHFDEIVALRERELALSADAGRWGELLESALTAPDNHSGGEMAVVTVNGLTRWP